MAIMTQHDKGTSGRRGARMADGVKHGCGSTLQVIAASECTSSPMIYYQTLDSDGWG